MANENINAYRTRITQIVCGLLLVGAFLFSIRGMMAGSFSKAGLVLAILVGGGLVFALDDKYWLLATVVSNMGFALPGLPFSSREVGCLVLVGVYFVRLALKKGTPFRVNRDLLVATPVLLWMFIVWMINPVGMAMLGSNTIGGRFYFDIALGTMALFVLSTIRVSERDAKFLFLALLVGQCWGLARGVIFPPTDPDALVFSGAEPERSTRYAFIVCASIFTLLFARWSLSSILSSPLKIPLFAILAILVVYSGKRRAFGTIALIPFFRMFLTGKEKLLTAVISVLAAVLLVFAVAGDGVAYRIPQSAQRVLAVVVPRYQRNGDGGIHDFFREQMREQARYVIKSDPWFGRKGFAMNLNETAWINFGGGYTTMFAGHAYSGNWHSTWYAYAADFGLPCMLFWAFFNLCVLSYAFRGCRLVTEGQFLPTCCLYYSFLVFTDAAFSYTSGHSSVTTVATFLRYGMLLAIVRGYRREHNLSEL